MNESKHPRVLSLLTQTPWAIRPEKFSAIREVLALRAAGERFTSEAIEARIGAGPPVRPQTTKATVAILPLYGVIMPRADLMTEMSGGTSLQRWSASFQAAVDDPQISGILIDTDSPGGLTDGVPELAAQIRDARGSKPIVAIANSDAASAAYWIASAADEIVVTPSGMVGSIGVFAAHEDISAQQEMDGIKTTLISAGKYKTEANPFEELTDEARAAIQERVSALYGMFVSDVAKNRGVSQSAVTNGYGEGRIVTSADAMKAGMVDRVATFEATVEDMIGRALASGSGGRARARASSSGTITTTDLLPGMFQAGVFTFRRPPDDDLPDLAPDSQVTITQHDSEATPPGGLSFVASAYAVRDAADKLVNDARSLNGTRRSHFTVAKRDGLKAAADALTASAQGLLELVAESGPEPDSGSEVLARALLRDAQRRHFPTTGAAAS